MAQPFFLLGLIASLLALLPCSIADVQITDLFTLEPGLADGDGGCGSREKALDD